MKQENDTDYLEEEMDDECRFRKSGKMYFIIMMILSFIAGALAYRSCMKIFY